MKKLVVFLFPISENTNKQEKYIEEALGINIEMSYIFDTLLEKKYLRYGYELAIVTYSDKDIKGITIEPNILIKSRINKEEFNKNENIILEEYKYIAKKLNPEKYDEIVMGGYHIGQTIGCVNTLANLIAKINKNVKIDEYLSQYSISYLNKNNKYYEDIKDKKIKAKKRIIKYENI